MTCIMKVCLHHRAGILYKSADPICTGEGHFDDGSNKPSGAATPIDASESLPAKRKGTSKKAKTAKQRLAIADGSGA